jgi:restriction system protein
MARRRRRASNGGLVLTMGAAAGVLWLWSQPWGASLFIALAAVAVAAGLARIAAAARRRRHRLHRLATLEGLLALTPHQFEDEVAELLRSLGFAFVHVSAGAGDLQADIVAVDPDGLATIVQCKRYAPGRTIGSPVIQSFIGMARIHHECERALFVTTGSFTEPAYRLADEHDIELIDGAELVDLFTQRAGLVSAG